MTTRNYTNNTDNRFFTAIYRASDGTWSYEFRGVSPTGVHDSELMTGYKTLSAARGQLSRCILRRMAVWEAEQK